MKKLLIISLLFLGCGQPSDANTSNTNGNSRPIMWVDIDIEIEDGEDYPIIRNCEWDPVDCCDRCDFIYEDYIVNMCAEKKGEEYD